MSGQWIPVTPGHPFTSWKYTPERRRKVIKITIESFNLVDNEQGYTNKVQHRTWLELTIDESDRVNKTEAMDIVRSVLLPGTHPIVEWPDKAAVPSAASIYDVMVKDKLIQWRDTCLASEREHRENHNAQAAEYHRGGTEAFNRVLNELLQ